MFNLDKIGLHTHVRHRQEKNMCSFFSICVIYVWEDTAKWSCSIVVKVFNCIKEKFNTDIKYVFVLFDSMNTSSSGRKTQVDHGVQIRFINDLCDPGGAQPGPQPKARPQTTSKYGVAVRVQGIAGQPYVVLKDGQKGDSYGVQLKTNYTSGYSSLPRRREKVEPGTGGADGGRGGGGQVGALRRAQSHGSLLDRDGEGGAEKEDFQLSRPPGDGKSGSYGNLDGGIGLRGERVHVSAREGDVDGNIWDGSHTATTEHSSTQRPASVNRLIDRFDGRSTGAQQRAFPPAHSKREASALPTLNPCSSPLSSTHSSLGHSQSTILASTGRYADEEAQQVSVNKDLSVQITLSSKRRITHHSILQE